MEQFVDDEQGYARWIASNPRGFVVNSYRRPTPGYLVLHGATCRTISGEPSRGRLWTKDYIKTCSTLWAELERWSLAEVGGHMTECGLCDPDAHD